jgi:iron complex outermembrane receptor protein
MAQDQLAVSEKDFLADMPIILSVSRLPQRLDDTPGSVTIIDHDMIRRSGARDMADLMRLVPGFQVSSSFESVAPLASYHGAFDSYSNRLELLIDGRSVYSPYFIGSIGPGLQTVALEDIERIEVQRGSNSAAYGSHAILGVINVVTRHTADTLGVQGSVGVGENGIRDAQARIGWGDFQGTFRLTADQRLDDGLAGAYGKNKVTRVNFRSDLHPTAADEVQVRLGGLSIDAGKGVLDRLDNLLHGTSFGTNYAQLDWRHNLGEDEDLALNLSHTRENYADRYPYPLMAYGINDYFSLDASGQSSADSVSLQHTFRHGTEMRVVWGGEYRREQITSTGLYNTDAPFVTDFTRLFGNLEWRINPSVVVNLGAMADSSSVTGGSLAPRFMANWHVADGQTLRAGVSRSFRPPSNYEKFANVRYVWNGRLLGVNTLSSGTVQSENVLSHELGYMGDFPRWGFNLDVRAFHEQISGFIRQQNKFLPRDYANDEDFSIRGVEYQAKWRPWSGAELVFNQTYTDIVAKQTLPAEVPWDSLSGTPWAAPKWATSIAYFQKLPGNLDLSLMHYDNGTATLAGSGSGSRVAMTRTDLRLGRSMRWGNKKGELALVVQNLGTPYPDFVPAFLFQRRAFVTLSLEN